MQKNKSIIAFILVQFVVVGGLAAAFAWRASSVALGPQWPEIRNEPRQILPTITDYSGYEVIVTDEQLARVLKLLRPLEQGRDTSVNHLDHALRFWGLGAEFDDPRYLSGRELRRRLVDHGRFVEVFGQVPPLLMPRDDGRVAVRMQQGRSSSSHRDHTLACLAEVGTPLDFPMVTERGETTVKALFDHALQGFSLNQTEYEWSALAFALYLEVPGANATWKTAEGQSVGFNELAYRIMRQDQPQGVCFGNHRLHALTVLLRVDDQTPILNVASRKAIIEYLKEMTIILIKNQSPDGFWHRNWPYQAATTAAPQATGYDTIENRLLATGHALEWWAYAPLDLQPPRDVMARAGQYLVRNIEALTEDQLRRMYPFLTHAGRSLALWRGVAPADVPLD